MLEVAMAKVISKVSWRHSHLWGVPIAGLAIVGALALSLLNHWEMTPEAWYYWFFARVFAESGRFIVPDRSPLYTLYLNAFRWLDYPTSVTVEYLVTSLFSVISLVVLFRRYLGLSLAVFAALLWIPFLQQVVDSPVQRIALALMCWAVVARQTTGSRSRLAVSYALLGLSSMFRATSIVAILVFAAWDILRILKQKGLRTLLTVMRPQRSDWPIGLVVVLFIWFATMQSPHPWNNVWVASTSWFPSKGKTLTEGAFIQNFNIAYIARKYRSFEERDFYFTNQELFGGAGSVLDAIRANPQFVVEQIARNMRALPGYMIQLTELRRLALFSLGGMILAVCIAILYGALRASRDEPMILFVIVNVLHLGIITLFYPRPRWMAPAIPILILSAYWYGLQAREILLSQGRKALFWIGLIGVGLMSLNLIQRLASAPFAPGKLLAMLAIGCAVTLALVAVGRYGSQDTTQRWSSFLRRLAIPLILVLLSNGVTSWMNVIRRVASDIRQGEIRVLEQRNFASWGMKASFEGWHPLVRECKGILSLEHTFVGAFMNVSLDRVYDIWEIPPFGHLGDSVYDGLRRDRVDCVLVSEMLVTGVGGGTNHKIRYENYIKPYVKQLQDMGAATYDIPRFGQVIILPMPGRSLGFR